MTLPARFTLREIAAIANVSAMTVSRALNGHKEVSSATRSRILEVCRQVGYTQDPLVSAALRYVRAPSNSAYNGTLGLLHSFPQPDAKKVPGHTYQMMVENMERKAVALGYGLEVFHASDPRMRGNRLSKRLLDYGVRGIILPPAPSHHIHYRLKWEHFTTVSIGYTLRRPEHHRVASDLSQGVMLTCNNLQNLGYRRIGLMLSRSYDKRTRHLISSAFLGWHHLSQPIGHPLFLYQDEPLCGESFLSWYRQTKPDCLLISPMNLGFFRQLGLKVPEDLGIAVTDTEPYQGSISGLCQRQADFGTIAVGRITNFLNAGEVGIPTAPTVTLLAGHWVSAGTTRKQ